MACDINWFVSKFLIIGSSKKTGSYSELVLFCIQESPFYWAIGQTGIQFFAACLAEALLN